MKKALVKVRSRRGRVWDVRHLTQGQLASLVGVTSPAVTAWRKRGCPRGKDRTYDLVDVVRWLRAGAVDLGRLPQTEILRLIGVSKPALAQMEQRGMPRADDRSYDAVAVVRWRLQELEDRASQARQLSAFEKVRMRKTAADAERGEMELAERRGELLPRAAVVSGWVARYQTLKAALLGLLGRLRSYGVTAAQQDQIREDVMSVLGRLGVGQVSLQLSEQEEKVLTKLLKGGRDD